MKILFSVVFVWLCVTFFCIAEEQNKTLLVKISDRADNISYQVMTPNEYKSLYDEINAEAKLYVKALAIAKKAWKEDEDAKRKPFPGSAISLRKAIVVGTYPDTEKATAKLEYYERKMDEKLARDKEKQEERDKFQKKSKEVIQREKEKASDKELLYNKARTLYESKLAELMKPPAEQKPAEQKQK